VNGFSDCDIQLQEGVVDRFIKHQEPCYLSELQSIRLLDDFDYRHGTARRMTSSSSAVNSQLPVSHRHFVDKAAFVKHEHSATSSRLKLQHKDKHGTTTSLGMINRHNF